MHTDIHAMCVQGECSVHEAVAQMDRSKLGIILVVDRERRLVGTVTDGDIRRAVLERMQFDTPILRLIERKSHTPFATPITAALDADRATWLGLLKEHNILHLPLLDRDGRVAGLATMDEFLPTPEEPLHAVVMAGGFGKRLYPLTEELPKPMLPVGDQPLLEIIIKQLRDVGVKHVNVTTHHQSGKIMEHFGDGSDFGVSLSYVEENQPLGTVGGLGLLEIPKGTTLVINGDILTQVDFRAMLTYHRQHQADLTVAVRHYDVKVPYGVVQCEGTVVTGLCEKPVVEFFVNAGIYLLEPAVYQWIPAGRRFDMTDLIHGLLQERRRVIGFPIREYWLDIGERAEYEQAHQDVREGKVRV